MHIGLQAPSPSSGAFPASPKPPLPLAGGSRRSYRYRAGRARFLVSRAKPRAPRVPQVPDLPALQTTPLPHMETSHYRYPAVSRRSHGYRAQRARLSVTRAKSPPFAYTGLQPLQLLNAPLSRNLEGPTTLLWWKLAGPADIEPPGLDIRFRAPNRPPSCIPGHKPPSPSTNHAPAPYNPSPLDSARIPQVPPTSSPWGSMFGFVRQTGPPRASQATSPPALQLTTRLQPTTPPHWIQVESRRSHRCRAQGARFSVSCAKPAPLVHSGPQAPQPFN
jgi:hypothetical protein